MRPGRPFYLFLLRVAVYMYHLAATDIYRSCRVLFLVNFNERRVNAKLVWDAEWFYPLRRRNRVDYWCRPPKWPLCFNATERNEYPTDLGGAKLSNRFASMHEIRAHKNMSKQSRDIRKQNLKKLRQQRDVLLRGRLKLSRTMVGLR